MPWPDVIADPEGDLLRENKILREHKRFWRGLAIALLIFLFLTWFLILLVMQQG